jgi:hypothetical protein
MPESTNSAFKEWAVVVDALGGGEQVLILRKGGIHEQRGQFRVEHRQFWLFPTRFHEAETSVIPAKRTALHAAAGRATTDTVEIRFFAEVTDLHHLGSWAEIRRLQGQHIWSEPILQQRFDFGREPGLHALIVRVSALPAAQRLPLRESYDGCKSWIELEQAPAPVGLTPVLDKLAFQQQRGQTVELLSAHAIAHL